MERREKKRRKRRDALAAAAAGGITAKGFDTSSTGTDTESDRRKDELRAAQAMFKT